MEPIGSWLGRVAARYRMSVDELAEQYGLELDFDRSGNAWLLVTQIGGATIEKLAALAHVDAAVLDEMQLPQATWVQPRQLFYCQVCIFLNPLDVTSPCWKLEWLDPSATGCAIHALPLRRLSISSLRSCGNFDKLLRLISSRERERRARSSWANHPR